MQNNPWEMGLLMQCKDSTSWPYFRVKLSCVCLKFTYKKKSKNKMVKKDTQYLLLVGFKKIKYKKKG